VAAQRQDGKFVVSKDGRAYHPAGRHAQSKFPSSWIAQNRCGNTISLGSSEAEMRDIFKYVFCISFVLCTVVVCSPVAFAQQPAGSAACNQATPEPVTDVALPGHPFMALATPDGCWIFVSMRQNRGTAQSGVAVVQRTRGKATLVRVVPLGNGLLA